MKKQISRLAAIVLALVLLIPTLVGAAPKKLVGALVVGDEAYSMEYLKENLNKIGPKIAKEVGDKGSNANIYIVVDSGLAFDMSNKAFDQKGQKVTLTDYDPADKTKTVTSKYEDGFLVEDSKVEVPVETKAKAGPKVTLSWNNTNGIIITKDSAKLAIGNVAELPSGTEYRWYEKPAIDVGVGENVEAKVMVIYPAGSQPAYEIVPVKVDIRPTGSLYSDIENPTIKSDLALIRHPKGTGDLTKGAGEPENGKDYAYIEPKDVIDKDSYIDKSRVDEDKIEWVVEPKVNTATNTKFTVRIPYKDGSVDEISGSIAVYDTGIKLVESLGNKVFEEPKIAEGKNPTVQDLIKEDYRKFFDFSGSPQTKIAQYPTMPGQGNPVADFSQLTAQNEINGYRYEDIYLNLVFADNGETDANGLTINSQKNDVQTAITVMPNEATAFNPAPHINSDIIRINGHDYSEYDANNANDIVATDGKYTTGTNVTYKTFFKDTIKNLATTPINDIKYVEKPTLENQRVVLDVIFPATVGAQSKRVTIPVKVVKDLADLVEVSENVEIPRIYKPRKSADDLTKLLHSSVDKQAIVDQINDSELMQVKFLGEGTLSIPDVGPTGGQSISIEWLQRPDLSNAKTGDFVSGEVLIKYPDGSEEPFTVKYILVEENK